MKKLVFVLISISFVSFLSSGSLFAQDKIGLNFKGFLGIGSTTIEVDNLDVSIDSDTSFPQLALGVSYQFTENIPFEAGVFFHYNSYDNLKIIDDSGYDLSYDLTMTKFALEALYTFTMVPVVHPYVAIDLFPYVDLGGDASTDENFMAVSGIVGAKFSINDTISLLTQITLEHLLEKDKVSANNLNFMFGVGVSL